MGGFVRVSGYSQKDIDDAYDAGYADGQVHPSLTSQTRSPIIPAGDFSSVTMTFSFAHRVVGLSSWSPFVAISSVSINGNTVTIGGRHFSTDPDIRYITAVGY